jgi:hypothetical protein
MVVVFCRNIRPLTHPQTVVGALPKVGDVRDSIDAADKSCQA